MRAFVCKMCGGQLSVDERTGIATCEYCGTRQSVPLFTEDSERLLYESGNSYLLHGEYDKAENVFNQLLAIRPGAAELYWALVLCRYGVTYVKDPGTGKFVPTCNRTHYTSIFQDDNYLKATQLASAQTCALYKADAATIDQIQRGILEVAKQEKPFDIFISYKETDDHGNRTKDSVVAQRLYELLVGAGYQVFYSRVTLEDKIGTEYEPYIYAALRSSRVMLTVGSCRENLEAAWVRNEWSRFLLLQQGDPSKTLLPLYFCMDRSELPEEFALLSAYNLQAPGFEGELLRGIQKLIPKTVTQTKRSGQTGKLLAIAAAVLLVLGGITAAIGIPKLVEKEQVRTEREDREEDREEGREENREEDREEEPKDPQKAAYDAAMQLYYDGQYAQAAWAFEDLGDYQDAQVQMEAARLSWRKSLATTVSYSFFDSAYGCYYITPNGALVHGETGQEVYTGGAHGKVISVERNILLHEDGTVGNTEAGAEWKDIIQVTPEFSGVGYFALNAQGKVLFDVNEEGLGLGIYCDVIEEFQSVTQWENIVELSAFTSVGEGVMSYVLVGVDAEGNVFQQEKFYWGGELSDYRHQCITDHPDVVNHVKTIRVAGYHSEEVGGKIVVSADVVAVTKDGDLITYIGGVLDAREAPEVVETYIDTFFGNTLYTIHTDGKLYKNEGRTLVLNDVVKISGDHLITRSGAVYEIYSMTAREGYKTIVYDEWLARLE